MAAYNNVIECYQGADLTMQFGFFNPDPSGYGNVSNQVPYNFTGYHVRMQIRYSLDPASQVLDSFSDTIGGLSFVTVTTNPGPPTPGAVNGVQLTIGKAKTITYPGGTYYYDLFADNTGAGTSQVLVAGNFIVGVTVTRL